MQPLQDQTPLSRPPSPSAATPEDKDGVPASSAAPAASLLDLSSYDPPPGAVRIGHSSGFVALIDSMGSDLRVVNSARVSFSKQSPSLSVKDEKLIYYLAANGHWTPFASCMVTLHICMPIFVARQLMRHNVGIVWNEESRRYVSSPPKAFHPDSWRLAPEPGKNKQGSSSQVLSRSGGQAQEADNIYKWVAAASQAGYFRLLKLGVAPEQARMVLLVAAYTQVYATMSLVAAVRICRQRLDSHAQSETRDYAEAIAALVGSRFPISWPALIASKAPE